jgi:alcohol dehydrogenase class IV
MTVNYNFPTPIISGPGAISHLPTILRDRGFKRTSIVTDRGIVGLPWFKKLVDELSKGFEVTVFSDFQGNPVCSHVDAGTAFLREVKAESVIAIGGGAALDVAKAMVLMQNHGGHLFDYEDGNPDAPPVEAAIADLIAIPTTAGTGSEVGRSAVISDDETHAKKIIFSPRLLPTQVIADPELTLGLPASLTASTGFDALTHLLEAFLARGEHPMCDGIALEGLRLVSQHLIPAVQMARANAAGRILGHAEAERHLDARDGMLNAALMGAVAFQKGLGVNHSCAHALSTVNDVHHGLANALMLIPCMRFNAEVVPERFVRVAKSMDISPATPEAFFNWVEQALKDTGLPRNLSEIGVKASDITALVDVAMADVCHPLGPRAVHRAQFVSLFEEALNR